MKNDLIKSFKLIKYSLSMKMNITMAVLFFLLGLAMELYQAFWVTDTVSEGVIPFGAVFMICTAMFPSQMLVSLDVSLMAQASAYKKKLQTSLSTLMILIGNLVMFTLILIIRMIGVAVTPGATLEMMHILPVGIFSALIILYSGIVYKFFIMSIIVLYAILAGFGGYIGYMTGSGQLVGGYGRLGLGTAADIILSYVLIFVAAGIGYLISLAVYKFPLSRYAFRCYRGADS